VITVAVAGAQSPAPQTESKPAPQIDIKPGVWHALAAPEPGKGPSGPIKHLTPAYHPPSGRIYFTGGDYRGRVIDLQSYRQETWSLSIAERWAARASQNAGWRLEYPYCGPPDQVQPKHPDSVGWSWDSKRSVFWMVPGVMEGAGENCPGETPTRTSDPAFLAYRLMQFDPATRKWKDAGGKIGDPTETWMSVYDAKHDTLIRFGLARGGAAAGIYEIESEKWSYAGFGRNGAGKDVWLRKEYLALDAERRAIYAIDGISGRLHRYDMDARALVDLGPVPGGPNGQENYKYVSWDSTAKLLVWVRENPPIAHTYDPEAKSWQPLSLASTQPGVSARGRVMIYDPVQNVTLLMGGYTDNPHIFLYRFPPR
jgi:hypothetical protein